MHYRLKGADEIDQGFDPLSSSVKREACILAALYFVLCFHEVGLNMYQGPEFARLRPISVHLFLLPPDIPVFAMTPLALHHSSTISRPGQNRPWDCMYF